MDNINISAKGVAETSDKQFINAIEQSKLDRLSPKTPLDGQVLIYDEDSGTYIPQFITATQKTGDGDMTRAIYDPNGNGFVDKAKEAEKLAGVSVTNGEINSLDGVTSNVQDQIDQLFTSANNGKAHITSIIGLPTDTSDTFIMVGDKLKAQKDKLVTKLTDKGVIATGLETLSSLIDKVGTVVTSVLYGTANPSDVLAGKTFGNATNENNTGTMVDKTNSSTYITPSNVNQAIPEGYYPGNMTDGYVKGESNLIAGNVRQGASIFGVVGTHLGGQGNAVATDVVAGKTFANADGTLRTGTIPVIAPTNITPSTTNKVIPYGLHNGAGNVLGDANLVAANIMSGKSIFGVAGSAVTSTTKYASGTLYHHDGNTFFNLGWTPTIVATVMRYYTNAAHTTWYDYYSSYYNGICTFGTRISHLGTYSYTGTTYCYAIARTNEFYVGYSGSVTNGPHLCTWWAICP